MKISKKRLRQIIREERARLMQTDSLNESTKGSPSIGFAGWSPNRQPDFAKAYGRDARVIGRYQSNNDDLTEQPLPASGGSADDAFNKLKMGGAWKDLQEMMHDIGLQISEWQNKHEADLTEAKMDDVGLQLEVARLVLDDLRQLANQFR